MQSSKRPTKAQQEWQDWQREQGCIICDTPSPSIHHCIGSAGKHNKVDIGQWWTIPLCYECHQGDEGIHKSGLRIPYATRKEAEKALFSDSYGVFMFENKRAPMPDSVYDAIMDYHK